MLDNLPFRRVDDYPADVNGPSVIVRLLDSLGFRFYWATEGLTSRDYDFSPGSGCQHIRELIGHIWGLTNWMCLAVFRHGEKRPQEIELQRNHVLVLLHRLREHFVSLRDDELNAIIIDGRPFWHLINGPMADALTHIGQINSFRRLAGNPAKRSHPFTCMPPDEET
jgi:hypothetical protein